MKLGRSIPRPVVLALCELVLFLLAGSAWALGVNFSVKTGAVGVSGTAVNASSDSADIYVGAMGNNVVRIPRAALGLQPGDEVDALSIVTPGLPTWDEAYATGFFFFSVDPSTVGIPGVSPDVASEAAASEAAGDIFVWTSAGPPGGRPGILA